MSLTATDPKRTSSFEFLDALRWALACALCAGSMWFVALSVPRFIWGVSAIDPTNGAAYLPIVYSAIGAGYGLIVGAFVGFFCGERQRESSVLALSVGGLLFGGLGGGLSVIVAAMTAPGFHPTVSSSLVWAGVGGGMGLYGYLWSCWITVPVELLDDEEETLPADRTVQWLLRERKRRWRELPAVRVSPVFVVSVSSLIGAAIAAPSELSLGLLVLSALGLSVAWVLYNQETRLRFLERRLRGRE